MIINFYKNLINIQYNLKVNSLLGIRINGWLLK